MDQMDVSQSIVDRVTCSQYPFPNGQKGCREASEDVSTSRLPPNMATGKYLAC